MLTVLLLAWLLGENNPGGYTKALDCPLVALCVVAALAVAATRKPTRGNTA